MKKINNFSKKGMLILVAIMLLTIPNLKVYSSVGNYNTSSMALNANSNYKHSLSTSEKAVWPAILAVAAGIGLAVIGGVGFVDGWNSIGSQMTLASIDFENKYANNEFSKFDN